MPKAPKKQERSQPKAVRTKKAASKKITKKSFIEQLKARKPIFNLTAKQLKYRHNRFVLGMSQCQAALDAGYAKGFARANAFKVDRLVKVGIVRELDVAGATDQFVAESLFDIAKNAMKMQSCVVELKQVGGDTVVEDQSRIEVPDLPLRLSAVETIAKIKKHISNKEHVPVGVLPNWIIVVDSKPSEPSKVIDVGHNDKPDAAAKSGLQITLQ